MVTIRLKSKKLSYRPHGKRISRK